MKLVLEIPKKENRREIEKVYEVEGYELPFEIIDEVLESIDLETEDKFELGSAVIKNIKKIKPILLDIFEGLTAEELGRASSIKIASVILAIVANTKEQLTAEAKKVLMGHK